jgi:glycosyltransferase involved in cell wall biosynthesis
MNHAQVAALMQQSGIFVQHSLVPESGDSEGTPVSILEAGASGMPIVATKHGGIVDAVLHDETGFLVEEGDVEGMAEYMYLLLSDSELANQLGQQGRKHVNQNFNIEDSIRNLKDVLDRQSM